MPKKKSVSNSQSKRYIDNTFFVMLALGVVFGFIAGYMYTKNRYMDRLDHISVMNMEKSDTINQLRDQLKVLGASTEK